MNDTLQIYCSECKYEISIIKAARVLVVSWKTFVHLSKWIEFERYLDVSTFVSMEPEATMR